MLKKKTRKIKKRKNREIEGYYSVNGKFKTLYKKK